MLLLARTVKGKRREQEIRKLFPARVAILDTMKLSEGPDPTDLPHHPGTIVYLGGDELVDELPVDEVPEGRGEGGGPHLRQRPGAPRVRPGRPAAAG